MAYTDVFLKMLASYRSEIGAAFPLADPESVLKILRECNKPGPKSQRQIELATNLPQPTVSKLMPKMIDREWLERSERDPATSVKQVQITFRGTGVLLAFEQACRKAAKTVSKSTLSNR